MTFCRLGRLTGAAVLSVLTVMVLVNGLALPSGAAVGVLHALDLVFHEAGHVLFGFFGRFLGVVGGSLTQVLVPAICAATFLVRGQIASAAAPLFWMGQSLADVAVYVADGRAMALPLLADGLIHDWNYILGTLGLLYRAEALGVATFALGAIVMLASVGLLVLDAFPRVLSSWPRSGG
jgi:hypothetical protein